MGMNGGRSLELDDLAAGEPLEAHALQAAVRDLAAASVLALQRVGAAVRILLHATRATADPGARVALGGERPGAAAAAAGPPGP